MKDITIVPMLKETAEAVNSWVYEGVYSFYNAMSEDVSHFLDGEHYACFDEDGSLVGMLAYGEDTRIPTVEEDVYIEDRLDIGVKMRPDMCGRGFGEDFVNRGLSFARKSFGAKSFRLSVAAFNERAIKVYKRCGFVIQKEVTNAYFNNKFCIMIKDKDGD